MGLHKGWLEKYTPKALRRRLKHLPLSAQEREKKRAGDALRKRQSREMHRDELRARIRLESASCADVDWLKRFVVEVPERPGCWIWKGPWSQCHATAKPAVYRGECGFMYADRAMWAALERPGLIKRHYLKTTCGHIDCIGPDHLYVTNQTLETARKNLAAEGAL
jgi:hypothetical protein